MKTLRPRTHEELERELDKLPEGTWVYLPKGLPRYTENGQKKTVKKKVRV